MDCHVVLAATRMLNSSLCVTDALPITSRDIAQPALKLILSPYVLQHTQEVTWLGVDVVMLKNKFRKF